VKSYSLDLRRRVLADCDAGLGTKAAAQKYSVSPAWVRRLKQRRREDGSIDRRPPSPGRPVKLAPHEGRVRDLVRDDPDATLNELRARLGVAVSVAALHAFLCRCGLSFEKK
jgi:transposase